MEKFSSFGQVDVMPFAQRRVLVAVANHKRLEQLLFALIFLFFLSLHKIKILCENIYKTIGLN